MTDQPDQRQTLTAYIIAGNEEAQIADCVENVAWCDRVLVVDSESSDRTVELAQAAGADVLTHKWPGYAEQKRYALSQVQTDWALNLDADERISERLRRSIEQVLRDKRAESTHGYRCMRSTWHLGRFFRSGLLWEKKVRLTRVGHADWVGTDVHERIDVRGAIGQLDGPMIHLRNRTLEQEAATYNRYSTLKAAELQDASVGLKLLTRPLHRFIKGYLLRGGFREGTAGLIQSLEEASYVFYKYAKVWERQHGKVAPDDTDRPPE